MHRFRVVPVLAGKQNAVRDSLFTAYIDVQRAVRDDRWKLIMYPQINKTQLFDLLRPADIGVELTEGFMMEPEASVSALVFHHPDATYFSAGVGEEEAEVVGAAE